MTNILITSTHLNVADCVAWVTSPTCGGIDVFIGTVRNETRGKRVVRLEFEAYESMALKEMEKIATTIFEQWNVEKVLMHHAIGNLEVGEIPVIIAVAAAHRAAAFEACRFAIDSLKTSVPIWKKEVFEDGEIWVSTYP